MMYFSMQMCPVFTNDFEFQSYFPVIHSSTPVLCARSAERNDSGPARAASRTANETEGNILYMYIFQLNLPLPPS